MKRCTRPSLGAFLKAMEVSNRALMLGILSLCVAIAAAPGAAAAATGPFVAATQSQALASQLTATASGNGRTPGAGRVPDISRWLPPLGSLTVLAEFAPPEQDWLPGHRGVDLAVSTGEPVRAPAAGTVAFAGDIADRPVVVIDHGPIRSTYEPVTGTVPVGQTVPAGAVIGEMATGGHCGTTCLHWGAISAELYIDPLLLVRGYVPVLKTPW